MEREFDLDLQVQQVSDNTVAANTVAPNSDTVYDSTCYTCYISGNICYF